MEIKQKFGLVIRELRINKGVSQEKLALDADIDRTYIGHIEKGSRNVSIEIVEELATYFQMSISELFKIIEEKNNMKNSFTLPPKNILNVMSSKQLTNCLESLIGKSIKITGKPRTDGSTVRKMVEDCIKPSSTYIVADPKEYKIIPKQGKGIPRLLLELVDTYNVTSGTNYNLQIWNRIPNSKSTLIEYDNGKKIRSCDIRLILLKINLTKSTIESIVILTPSYIVNKFGSFGKL